MSELAARVSWAEALAERVADGWDGVVVANALLDLGAGVNLSQGPTPGESTRTLMDVCLTDGDLDVQTVVDALEVALGRPASGVDCGVHVWRLTDGYLAVTRSRVGVLVEGFADRAPRLTDGGAEK